MFQTREVVWLPYDTDTHLREVIVLQHQVRVSNSTRPNGCFRSRALRVRHFNI